MHKTRAKRYEVWFPMSFDTGDRADGMAVSQNLSKTGVLMATAAELEEGATVTLTFRLTLQDKIERTIQGSIVRVAPNSADPNGMWPHHVAVEFDDQMDELESLLDELPASQRSL